MNMGYIQDVTPDGLDEKALQALTSESRPGEPPTDFASFGDRSSFLNGSNGAGEWGQRGHSRTIAAVFTAASSSSDNRSSKTTSWSRSPLTT